MCHSTVARAATGGRRTDLSRYVGQRGKRLERHSQLCVGHLSATVVARPVAGEVRQGIDEFLGTAIISSHHAAQPDFAQMAGSEPLRVGRRLHSRAQPPQVTLVSLGKRCCRSRHTDDELRVSARIRGDSSFAWTMVSLMGVVPQYRT